LAPRPSERREGKMKSLKDVAPDLETVVALGPERGGGAVREGGLAREDPDLEARRKSMEMVRTSLRNPSRKRTRMATKIRRRTAVRVLRKTLRGERKDPSRRKWSLKRRTTA